MFDTYNNKQQRDSHKNNGILLLVIDIISTNAQLKLPPLTVVLAGILVLTGLSGSLQASPDNTQTEHVEPRLYLNFSADEPITLSNMIPLNVPSGAQSRQRHDLDSGLAPADATTNAKLRDYFPPKITLTRDSVSAANPLGRELEGVSSGTQGVKLTRFTLSSADKLANNSDAAPTESEDNPSDVEKPLVAGVVRSPFVTITLAGLALLGLVSVSRRNDL